MSAQIVDYAAMLADLEAKKAVIDSTIAAIRAAMAAGALGTADASGKVTTPGSSTVTPFDGDIPSGLFTGKSIPEATKLYLSMVNRKQSTKEIAQALEEGGMHTTSDNFVRTVEAGLFRASRKFGDIVRVKGQWALPEWYKGMRVGPKEAATPKKKGKRKAKARATSERPAKSTPKATKAPKLSVEPIAVKREPPKPISKEHGAQSMIEEFFTFPPADTEMSAAEVAEGLGIRVQTVGLICAKLVHAGKLERAASGKFRWAKLHAMPKAV